jgi:hypothetical protein
MRAARSAQTDKMFAFRQRGHKSRATPTEELAIHLRAQRAAAVPQLQCAIWSVLDQAVPARYVIGLDFRQVQTVAGNLVLRRVQPVATERKRELLSDQRDGRPSSRHRILAGRRRLNRNAENAVLWIVRGHFRKMEMGRRGPNDFERARKKRFLNDIRIQQKKEACNGRNLAYLRQADRGQFAIRLFDSIPHDMKKRLEAGAGIEPAVEVLQTSALPLGYPADRPFPALAGLGFEVRKKTPAHPRVNRRLPGWFWPQNPIQQCLIGDETGSDRRPNPV